jgi:rare lipoprotein A
MKIFPSIALGLMAVNLSCFLPLSANPDSAKLSLLRTHEQGIDGKNQRIVYLRGIPIVAFTGDRAQADSQEFVSLVERAIQEKWDAEQIQPVWENNRFQIRFSAQTAWELNTSMTFPETTGNRVQDTLLIVNRLRRLLGAQTPITTIANLPASVGTDSTSADATGVLVEQVLRVVRVLTGMASWYGPGFHGNRSASGEIFDQNALTAAHPNLPFGTNVRVINMQNGQSVIVRINDRGPFTHNRVIDVSKAAAQRIGLTTAGVAPVKLEVLAKPK